jgi:hypothetical protein
VSEAGDEEQENNNNNNDQQQPPIIQDNESAAQDFSEPLSPAEAIIDEPQLPRSLNLRLFVSMSQCLNANISSGRRPVAACQSSASFKKGSCVACMISIISSLSVAVLALFIGLSSFTLCLNCRSENSTEWNSKNSRAHR